MSKSILDPTFRYVPARVHQDSSDYLRAKFRKLMKAEADRRKANEVEAARVVTKLPKAKP